MKMKIKLEILITIFFLTLIYNKEIEGCLESAVSKNVFMGRSEHRIFCTNVPESSPIGSIACEFTASYAKEIEIANIGDINITKYVQLNQVGGSDRLVQFVIAQPITDILDSELPKSSLEGQLNCITTTGFTRENKFTMVLKEENDNIPTFAKEAYVIHTYETAEIGKDIAIGRQENVDIIATDHDNSPYPTSSNIIKFSLKNNEDETFEVETIEVNNKAYPKNYKAVIKLKKPLHAITKSEHSLTLEAWNSDATHKSIATVVVQVDRVTTVNTSSSTTYYLSTKEETSTNKDKNETERIEQMNTTTEVTEATTTYENEFEFSGDEDDDDDDENNSGDEETQGLVDYLGISDTEDDEEISGDWVRHYDFYQ